MNHVIFFFSCADQDAESDQDQTLELSQGDFGVLEDLPGSPPSPPENTPAVHDSIHEARQQLTQTDNGAAAAPRTASQSPGTRNGLLGQTLAVELYARLQALRDENEEKREQHKQKALALHEEHKLKMEQLRESHADELEKRKVIHNMQVRLLKAKLKTQRLKARLLAAPREPCQ